MRGIEGRETAIAMSRLSPGCRQLAERPLRKIPPIRRACAL